MPQRAQIHAWMAAAREGDRRALDPLFDALWPVCAGYATRLLGGDRALAEDCTQEALASLFGQLDRFDASRDGLTWALTLTTWECRTARRRRGREAARTAPAPERVEPTVDGAALAVERDLVRGALAALATLAPADVEAITASLAGGAPAHVAPATFRKRLERGLARLRTAWRGRHGSI